MPKWIFQKTSTDQQGVSVDSKYGISCRSNTKKSGNPVCNFDWTEKCETIESRLAQGLIFSNRDRKGETPLMFLSVTLVVNLHPRLHGQWTCDELFFKSIPYNWLIWADVFGVFPIELSALVLDFLSIYIKLYNIMCFLQKDDIMLHFTLSGSSDITGSTNSVVVNSTFLF